MTMDRYPNPNGGVDDSIHSYEISLYLMQKSRAHPPQGRH